MKRLKEKEELKRLSVDERNDFVADELQRLISEMTELREENRLSQNQVSETLGLQSHGNLTLIEQGKSIPRLDRFLRILSVYGYTLDIISSDDA